MSKQSTWHKAVARILLVFAFLVAMSMADQIKDRGLPPPGPERLADLTMFLGVPLLLAGGAWALSRKDRRDTPA